jgi:hypothetical protein
MKVIFTTNLSDYGNDCYINKQVSLVECFGMYTVIIAEKVSGWTNSHKFYCRSEATCDFDRAKFMFKESGGRFE